MEVLGKSEKMLRNAEKVPFCRCREPYRGVGRRWGEENGTEERYRCEDSSDCV